MPDHELRTPSAPPPLVLDAFGAKGRAELLPGGQGTSWRVGDLVFKPGGQGDDASGLQWIAQVTETVHATADGFRVAEPVRANSGDFIVQGWSATRHLDGQLRSAGPADWVDLFAAGRAFNQALRGIERPDFLATRTDRWAFADRVAFGEAEYRDPIPKTAPLLERLIAQRAPCLDACQLVHGDLAKNVLFAPGFAPAVIDFSPYWRAAAFPDAVLTIDLLLWHGAPASLINVQTRHWGTVYLEYLVRAMIFRLVVFSENDRIIGGFDPDRTDRALGHYDQVYAMVRSNQSCSKFS